MGTNEDGVRGDTNSSGLGFKNEDFIVWMRTAAFPTFRKLYRRVEQDLAATSDQRVYKLLVRYNYPVHNFGGRKYFVIATTSWIGGKNLFLGYTYTIVGALCIVVAFALLLISKRNN